MLDERAAGCEILYVDITRVAQTVGEDGVSTGSGRLTFPLQTDETRGAGSDRLECSES